jgi:hypothetical protein
MAFPFVKLVMVLVKYGQELFLGQPPAHQRRRKTDVPFSRLESLKKIFIWAGSISIIGCVYLVMQLYHVSSKYNKLVNEKKEAAVCPASDDPVVKETPSVPPETPSAPLEPPQRKQIPALILPPTRQIPKPQETTDDDNERHQRLLKRLHEIDSH